MFNSNYCQLDSYRKNCLTMRVKIRKGIVMNKLSICIKYILIFRCTLKNCSLINFKLKYH